MPKVILSAGASSNSIGRFFAAGICARKYVLSEADRLAALAAGPQPFVQPQLSDARGVGTIFHGLCSEYHREPALSWAEAVEFVDETGAPYTAIDAEISAEALRVFHGYRKEIPPEFFGKVEAVELPIGAAAPVQIGSTSYDLSGRLDMLVRLSEADCERLGTIVYSYETKKQPKIMWDLGVEPGLYIVDHKTEAQRGKAVKVKFEQSLKFAFYQHVWNLEHPADPVHGVLANVVFKTAKVEQWTVQQSAMRDDPSLLMMLESEFRSFERRRVSGAFDGRGDVSPLACFNETYGRWCEFFEAGRCDRVS